MVKKNSIGILILLCALMISSFMKAQKIKESVAEFKKKTNAVVTTNANSDAVEFIRFSVGNSLKVAGNTVKKKAINFLKDNKSIYNIKSIDESLVFDITKTDTYGLSNVIFKQYYNGVPIYDGGVRVHFNKREEITAVNGTVIPNITLNSIPTINKSEAGIKALKLVNSQRLNNSGNELIINDNTLYVYQKGLVQGYKGANNLVYRIEVTNKLDVREFIFIDAHTGKKVEQFTGIAHALDRVVYEENTSTVVWSEGDSFPGSLDEWQQNEVSASGHTYHFFNNAFGYASYDGADAQMRTINNNPNVSCPNATWNGFTANYCDGTATDDVIAHEWGHAYTQFTNDLIYSYQSGALNEAYSDIWGETIDLINNYEDADEDLSLRTGCDSSDRWRIGEDASAFGGAIRDMWDPTCDRDPGKLSDDEYFCGSDDDGGVHFNSGVPNHVYALVVDGGTYNGQTINGLGLTKAAHIFWRVQSVYLTSSSDFIVFADALEAACADLVDVNLEGLSTTSVAAGPSGEIITVADCQEIAKAIQATELRIDQFDRCDYQPILGSTDPVCGAATNAAIFLEDWESGTDGWVFEQLPANAATWTSRDWIIKTSLPDNRDGSAIFGIDPAIGDCRTDLENGIIRLESPVISIPNNNLGKYEMTFSHFVQTEGEYDGGNIKYSLDGGAWTLLPSSAFTTNPYNLTLLEPTDNDNPMAGEEAYSGVDDAKSSGSWGDSTIDLSLIGVGANSIIQFRWEMGVDGCSGDLGWYLDDISVYNCIDTPLGIEENKLANSLELFHLQSTDVVTLRNATNVNLAKAELYGINGRIIKTIDLSDMETEQVIDMRGFSAGVYFMRIISRDNKEMIVKRVVRL